MTRLRAPTWLSFDDVADDHLSKPKPDTVDVASDLDQMLDEARAQGCLEGHARGMAQATADREELTRRTLDAIVAGMTGVEAGFHHATERAAEALGALLLATLSAMLPALCARHGPAEIATLAQAIVPALHRRPDVTFEVHPNILTALDAALSRLPMAHRRRMLLTPNDDIAPGDARLSWADGDATGHAQRDAAGTWARVQAVLADCGVAFHDIPIKQLERVT